MASTGTKLFKIASQINVGKETIVEFLQAKGFSIENKATATLTDAMVDLVMGNFQKEASAAEKQRAKVAPKQDEHDDHATHEHTHEMADHAPEAHHDNAREHDARQHDAHAVAHSPAHPSQEEHTPEAAPVLASEQHSSAPAESVQAKSDGGVAVGTVIQLEDSSSRRSKSKSGKDSVGKSSSDAPKQTDAAAKLDVTSELIEHDKPNAKSSAAKSSGSKAASTQDVTAQTTDSSSPSQPAQAQATSQEASAEQPVASAPHTDAVQEDTSSLASADDENDFEDGHHEDGSKRKRKKRIGEVFVDNAPYATPMPTGLTILGKIELGGGRRQGGPDQRGGGASRGDAPKGRTDGRAGGDKGAKPREAGKTGTGDGRERLTSKFTPATGAAKPKDWTKDGDTDGGGARKVGTGGGGGSASAAAKKKRKKNKREQVNAEDVDKAIRRTLAGQDESNLAMRTRLRQKRKLERAEEQERQAELREQEEGILRVTEFITVADLAGIMGVQTNDIIVKCMSLGLMVSINQRLEKDTITLIADDYGYEVEFEDAFSEEELVEDDEEEDEETLVARAPIVTVMGHVDHGKTSLLDHIRKTSVVSGESGGITQHIGAYSVKMSDGKFITFLDTPGHQAFTAMRARGAQVTDLVVLVVAADDNVMPQTIEAISHARAANVPMVVAINKIDKPEANPDKVRQQLSDHNVLVEEWGGKFQSAMISAKKGLNIEQLLEKILLEAELLNLRANPDRDARGTVVEAKIDKGKGPVATVIVQKGTLRVGDSFLSGVYAGRVRAMFNENGERIEMAIPSTPVQILGFDGVPQAGDSFIVMESEQEAREIANTRQQIKREQDFKRIRHVTLDDIASRIKAGGVQELKIILKGDTDGSVEALTDSLQKLSTPEVQVSIILRAVGTITESDIMLAAASEAIIIGFHVRPNTQAAKLAENEGVDIRLYRIIYDCINEVKLALEGMLQPEIKEEVVGVAEIREVFKISKLGNIAGCYMLEGKINRNDTVRLVRDGFEVHTGRLASLKRIKDDVREVDAGFECGIALDGHNDIQTGDLIEAVRKVEVKRKL